VQDGSTRYQLDDQGNWRCPPGEEFAAQYGLTYRVRASDQINWAVQDNWLYIEDYYQDLERLVLPDDVLERLYRIVDENPGITLSDLRSSTSDILSDQINIAIARHSLYVNLISDRLTEPRRARVFRDRRAALAMHHRGKEAQELGVEAHPVEIIQGQTVLWDGRSWRLNVGNTEITLIADD
jgi:putative transposase